MKLMAEKLHTLSPWHRYYFVPKTLFILEFKTINYYNLQIQTDSINNLRSFALVHGIYLPTYSNTSLNGTCSVDK